MKLGTSLITFLITLLISGSLQAEVSLDQVESLGLIYFQKAELSEEPYTAIVHYEKSEQVIRLFNSENKKIYEKKVSSLTDAFQKIDFIVLDNSDSPYAIIKLQKGVHGEQAFIISLEEGKEVFHQASVWPISIDIGRDGIDITIVDESKKSSQKRWEPKK